MAGQVATECDNGAAEFLAEMSTVCERQTFAPGDVLREKGQHYRNMYVIVDGECAVQLDPEGSSLEPITRKSGDPIGEIGFLRGTPANALVTALGTVQALVIDDPTLERLEKENPELVVLLLQRLAEIADDRTSYSLTLLTESGLLDEHQNIEVLLCRNEEMLTQAQRLRYEVYCEELGRNSPSAIPERRIIADGLDETGHCFIALSDGEVIGTIRTNFAKEGALGALEGLYGMNGSASHPESTAICTKFIVKRAHRGGRTAMELVSHIAQYGLRHEMKECFIDCVPKLVHYYRAMGFKVAAETFFHPENGPSLPMRLDLVKHGEELAGDIGIRRMVTFYLKAKAMKLAEGLRT